MKTVGFVSLGCARNQVDSEVMMGLMQKAGYRIVKDPETANVLVVNTCAFIDSAKQESVDSILEMAQYKEAGACEKLVVAGCLSQRYREELAVEIPEVDLWVGTGEFPKIVELLKMTSGVMQTKNVKGELISQTPTYLYDDHTPRVLTTATHSVYLKISEGCHHKCAFCIIPQLRGPHRSRPLDSILEEAKRYIGMGTKEINLIAQDSTAYGTDLQPALNLASLMKAMADLDGDKWVRLFYTFPHTFTDELVELYRTHPALCKYVDMPIQHVDEDVLKSMRRAATVRHIPRVIEKLRTAVPDITLRTTLIAGFPGETDAQFMKLLKFVEEGHFDHVGCFAYSVEDGTEAAKMEGQVPDDVKQERHAAIMAAQSKVAARKNAEKVGKTYRALIEGPSEETDLLWQARIESQGPEIDGVTYINDDSGVELKPGMFANVEITEAHTYDLVAKILPPQ
ncbi:MAG: 30S ribosomal protein S12 methylthiotransferase RimO [Deltaproteobacteria bacterium CG11_big_fil_rev_8_21_14_0_20_47_16]|nr:MAG: 30S ribosomal protein S12 methylthiotransferase RimO [Deltaproteobacteria bacterium CG11_big_fil_rev_8_21_14_0_20_47_16]